MNTIPYESSSLSQTCRARKMSSANLGFKKRVSRIVEEVSRFYLPLNSFRARHHRGSTVVKFSTWIPEIGESHFRRPQQ